MMEHKLVSHKVGRFRMWKSGKQWLFGASILGVLAVGSAIPVFAQEEATTHSSVGEVIRRLTMMEGVSEAESVPLETGNELKVAAASLSEVIADESLGTAQEPSAVSSGYTIKEMEESSSETKRLESSFLEDKSEVKSIELDSSNELKTPVTSVSEASTDELVRMVQKPSAGSLSDTERLSVTDTTPAISEYQEWTYGVLKPSKEDLVWQQEVYQGYYTSPYKRNSQLFDVNKEYTDQSGDFGLCSAGVAANMIHWWLEQNKEYVERYLRESEANGVVTPRLGQSIDLRNHTHYDEALHKSQIFDLFKSYFSNRSVYTHRVLDLFFSGYPNVFKYDVNQEKEYEKRETMGTLDRRGGFFKEVFKQDLLTTRKEVGDLNSFGMQVKQALAEKKALAVDYLFSARRGHIVNVWGAEFDEQGKLTALYVTDTDDHTSVIDARDEKPLQSLKRYRVIEKGGNILISNNYSEDRGVPIKNLYTLDLGERQWQAYFSNREKASQEPSDVTTPQSSGEVVAPIAPQENTEAGLESKVQTDLAPSVGISEQGTIDVEVRSAVTTSVLSETPSAPKQAIRQTSFKRSASYSVPLRSSGEVVAPIAPQENVEAGFKSRTHAVSHHLATNAGLSVAEVRVKKDLEESNQYKSPSHEKREDAKKADKSTSTKAIQNSSVEKSQVSPLSVSAKPKMKETTKSFLSSTSISYVAMTLIAIFAGFWSLKKVKK